MSFTRKLFTRYVPVFVLGWVGYTYFTADIHEYAQDFKMRDPKGFHQAHERGMLQEQIITNIIQTNQKSLEALGKASKNSPSEP